MQRLARFYAEVVDDVPVHEPHEVLSWLSDQNAAMEGQIKRALEKYVGVHVMGDWMTSIFGIGPVISAGLLAHIDMQWQECPVCHKKETAAKPCKCGAPFVRKTLATAGQLWRFAGLDPTSTWEKKTRRPWNAQLKVIAVLQGRRELRQISQGRALLLWSSLAQAERYLHRPQ